MEKDRTFDQSRQESFNNALEEALRNGAQKLLMQAIELEVAEYIARHAEERDGNGHLPKRKLQTGMGPIEVRQPRIRDRRDGGRFNSSILPPYARRTPSVETAIPTLYLPRGSLRETSQKRLQRFWEAKLKGSLQPIAEEYPSTQDDRSCIACNAVDF